MVFRKIDRSKYKEYIEYARECTANHVYPMSVVTGTQDGEIYTDDRGCILFWHYCGFAYISGSVSPDALEAIYRQLTKPKAPVDVDDIMKGLEEIVNEYISTEETPDDAKEPNAKIDISQIDFDKLATEFAKIKNKQLVINDINELVSKQLAAMLKTNPNRIDFYKHYLEVIEEYNRSQDKAVIEQVFNELLQTAKDMTEEQKRYVREGFDSDEELLKDVANA